MSHLFDTEPGADFRLMAATSRQIFVAHVEEGFSEEQAMQLTMTILGEGIRANRPGPAPD